MAPRNTVKAAVACLLAANTVAAASGRGARRNTGSCAQWPGSCENADVYSSLLSVRKAGGGAAEYDEQNSRVEYDEVGPEHDSRDGHVDKSTEGKRDGGYKDDAKYGSHRGTHGHSSKDCDDHDDDYGGKHGRDGGKHGKYDHDDAHDQHDGGAYRNGHGYGDDRDQYGHWDKNGRDGSKHSRYDSHDEHDDHDGGDRDRHDYDGKHGGHHSKYGHDDKHDDHDYVAYSNEHGHHDYYGGDRDRHDYGGKYGGHHSKHGHDDKHDDHNDWAYSNDHGYDHDPYHLDKNADDRKHRSDRRSHNKDSYGDEDYYAGGRHGKDDKDTMQGDKEKRDQYDEHSQGESGDQGYKGNNDQHSLLSTRVKPGSVRNDMGSSKKARKLDDRDRDHSNKLSWTSGDYRHEHHEVSKTHTHHHDKRSYGQPAWKEWYQQRGHSSPKGHQGMHRQGDHHSLLSTNVKSDFQQKLGGHGEKPSSPKGHQGMQRQGGGRKPHSSSTHHGEGKHGGDKHHGDKQHYGDSKHHGGEQHGGNKYHHDKQHHGGSKHHGEEQQHKQHHGDSKHHGKEQHGGNKNYDDKQHNEQHND